MRGSRRVLMNRGSPFVGSKTQGALVAHCWIRSILGRPSPPRRIRLKRVAGVTARARGAPPAPKDSGDVANVAAHVFDISAVPCVPCLPPCCVPCRALCRSPCRVPCRQLCRVAPPASGAGYQVPAKPKPCRASTGALTGKWWPAHSGKFPPPQPRAPSGRGTSCNSGSVRPDRVRLSILPTVDATALGRNREGSGNSHAPLALSTGRRIQKPSQPGD